MTSARVLPCRGCEARELCRDAERCWRSPLPLCHPTHSQSLSRDLPWTQASTERPVGAEPPRPPSLDPATAARRSSSTATCLCGATRQRGSRLITGSSLRTAGRCTTRRTCSLSARCTTRGLRTSIRRLPVGRPVTSGVSSARTRLRISRSGATRRRSSGGIRRASTAL